MRLKKSVSIKGKLITNLLQSKADVEFSLKKLQQFKIKEQRSSSSSQNNLVSDSVEPEGKEGGSHSNPISVLDQTGVQIHCIVFKCNYKYYKIFKCKYNCNYFGQDSN